MMNKSYRSVWSKAYLLVSPHLRIHPVADQSVALDPDNTVGEVTC